MKRVWMIFLAVVAVLGVGGAGIVMLRDLTDPRNLWDEAQTVAVVEDRFLSEFGNAPGLREVEPAEGGECSETFDLCYAADELPHDEALAFARSVLEGSHRMAETSCENASCGTVWRSDEITVVLLTFPEGPLPREEVLKVAVTVQGS